MRYVTTVIFTQKTFLFTAGTFFRKHFYYMVALAGGLLLWASWPVKPFTALLFVAFVPLLWIEDHTVSAKKFFRISYVPFFIWNLLTTWWIWNAIAVGAVLAIVANSLLMCIPWLLMHLVKKRLGRWAGYASLIAFWISFEYIHNTWELSWPWLTLGNAFAMQPGWIQWYEVTGTTGGSLWILISNLLFYSILAEYRDYGRTTRYFMMVASLLLTLFIPVLISNGLYEAEAKDMADRKNIRSRNVVVVQPNIDPYNEKFAAGTAEAQIQHLIVLSEEQIDSATSLVIWPETAVPVVVWENSIINDSYYAPIWNFLDRHPGLSLSSGIQTLRNYGSDKKNASPTARYNGAQHFYYDEYNAAGMFEAGRTVQFYHKSKLVPGAEKLPSFFSFMRPVFEQYGGGSYGSDKEQAVFADTKHYYLTAPIICYESIYAAYVAGYVRKGANILTVMTNDGWWGNTAGYRQHMNYARLRAIETRRWVARSANTGISCFIDPLGAVHQPQPWNKSATIKMSIPPEEKQTFFVRHGDYLSRIFNAASIIFLLVLIGVILRSRFFNHRPTTYEQSSIHQ